MKHHNFEYLSQHEKFLNPGELACGSHKTVFGTLLGSCVAITLWHPKHKFGCICHFILPSRPSASEQDGRYGDTAFDLMLKMLSRHGVRLEECVAKVFGGGRMFSQDSLVQDVGQRNIKMARSLLEQAGLTVSSENVGGDGYRRLYFDVSSGDVWIKFDWIDTEQKDLLL